MKNERAEPTPAVKYTKDTKFEICAAFAPEEMPKARWNPGSDGTIDEEP